MTKKPMTYFSSDWHFTHVNARGGILSFERGNKFNTIEEHDNYIESLLHSWANKWAPGSIFWFLGDFGNPDKIYVFDWFKEKGIETHFLLGNHDHRSNFKHLENHVDYIHDYPVFLSHKLAVSHQPISCYQDSINVHGHLHSAKLASINHINANIHVFNYQPVSEKYLASIFSKIPQYNRRYLYEPYAAEYVFTQPKDDAIYERDGHIDLAATRVYNLLNRKNSSWQ